MQKDSYLRGLSIKLDLIRNYEEGKGKILAITPNHHHSIMLEGDSRNIHLLEKPVILSARGRAAKGNVL